MGVGFVHSLSMGGEGKILIQLCSGFDGFWLGSTPRLASDAAQDVQGGPRVKKIQTDSHQPVLKPHRNLPSQWQSCSPGFYSSFDTTSRVK